MPSGRIRSLRLSLVLIWLLALVLPFSAPYAAADGPKDLSAMQGYLDPAPLGMEVRYGWTLPGGRGENVRIVDIEYNWNLNHNDLAAAAANLFVYVKGLNPVPDQAQDTGNWNHGTAVIGELVAADDGIGITGIAHGARLGLINPLTDNTRPDVAAAIRRAVASMDAGDVILLELQSPSGPRFDPFTGRGLLPIEYEPDIYAAIRSATSQGILIIESAGNGFENLDHSAYNGVFDRDQRDSGAIFVGAGLPEGELYGRGPDRTRTEESNYGACVDVQGWGRSITTTGFGDLRIDKGKSNWYTTEFGATSGGTAMVAGVVAVIQSIVKARGLAPLTPLQMRQLLTATGTPQTGDQSQHIGPRPNIRAAIAALDGTTITPDPIITAVTLKSSSGKLTVDGDGFTPGNSIIEIDGQVVKKLKYPSDHVLPSGLATRIVSKKDVSSLLPRGVQVAITVFTPSTGKRSAPFAFRRD